MKKKRIVVCFVIISIILGLIFKDNFIRLYVSICHDKLEIYVTQLLDSNESTTDSFGLWETSSYPMDNLVEFHTGGWGIAPSSTYKGFYYSADDTHQVFSAAYKDTVSTEIYGDKASWTDGTDNHGISIRIIENWFWFEASF